MMMMLLSTSPRLTFHRIPFSKGFRKRYTRERRVCAIDIRLLRFITTPPIDIASSLRNATKVAYRYIATANSLHDAPTVAYRYS